MKQGKKTQPVPTRMRSRDAQTLVITWSDGVECTYSLRRLRASCPCAECVNEVTGARIISVDQVPESIRALEARPVGRYAYQFVWSDRHDTGIYTYAYLRELCEKNAEQG